jgi:hypothetical protein
LDVEVGRTFEDPQNIEVPIPSTNEVLPLISRKEPYLNNTNLLYRKKIRMRMEKGIPR